MVGGAINENLPLPPRYKVRTVFLFWPVTVLKDVLFFIRCFDPAVLGVLRRMRHLFNGGINLLIDGQEHNFNREVWHQIWPLISSNISKLLLADDGTIGRLLRCISPPFLIEADIPFVLRVQDADIRRSEGLSGIKKGTGASSN